MTDQKFAWNEENTAAAIAAYQDAIAASGCEAANSDEILSGIATTIGAKNANSIRRKLVLEKVYQKAEKPAAAKREAKAADPLAWDEAKMSQAQAIYEDKIAKDGIAAANDTEFLTAAAATIGVKGAKAMVGKLAAMGVYQKAEQPRSVGGSKRVPKMTQIRQMAAKLDAIGIADALERLEPIEVANSSVIAFVSDLVDRLEAAHAGSVE